MQVVLDKWFPPNHRRDAVGPLHEDLLLERLKGDPAGILVALAPGEA